MNATSLMEPAILRANFFPLVFGYSALLRGKNHEIAQKILPLVDTAFALCTIAFPKSRPYFFAASLINSSVLLFTGKEPMLKKIILTVINTVLPLGLFLRGHYTYSIILTSLSSAGFFGHQLFRSKTNFNRAILVNHIAVQVLRSFILYQPQYSSHLTLILYITLEVRQSLNFFNTAFQVKDKKIPLNSLIPQTVLLCYAIYCTIMNPMIPKPVEWDK